MKKPAPLKKGDKIGLVSTARKISEAELQPAVDVFKSWGLIPVFGEFLFEEHHQFAGTDEQRARSLQQFIDDSEIKAIVCVRGGYGTVRIIDRVNFLTLAENPKWICGYSDVTVLLNKLNGIGFEALHSTMPIDFKRITKSGLRSFKKALFGESLTYEVPHHPFNKKGKVQGRLIGGNLSVLYSTLGSGTALKTDGNILFIEDLDEYLYHIDRMMQNLKRNGYFKNLAGMVVGSMSDMNDNTVPFGFTAEEIVRDTIKEYSFPVCFNFPAGHLDDNHTLIFGRKVTLEIGDSVQLTF